MDEVHRVRSVAVRGTRDIVPSALGDRIESRIEDAPVDPGRVVLASARHHGTGSIDDHQLACAAAVVQLYEGLRITRRLIDDDPWGDVGDHPDDADLEIIAADVLVSRAVSTLARTRAAGATVQVVREFGQYQASRRVQEGGIDARELEPSVVELAAVVGVASVDRPTDQEVLDAIGRVATATERDFDGLAALLEGTPLDVVDDIAHSIDVPDDPLRSGASDTD